MNMNAFVVNIRIRPKNQGAIRQEWAVTLRRAQRQDAGSPAFHLRDSPWGNFLFNAALIAYQMINDNGILVAAVLNADDLAQTGFAVNLLD